MANVEGAVHAGLPDPRDARKSALMRFVRQNRFVIHEGEGISGPKTMDISLGTRTLLVIGRVVHAGLQPLRDRIEQEIQQLD